MDEKLPHAVAISLTRQTGEQKSKNLEIEIFLPNRSTYLPCPSVSAIAASRVVVFCRRRCLRDG